LAASCTFGTSPKRERSSRSARAALRDASAIERLSFEERAKLAAWLHGWNDDEWDEQMKRDVASGKLDTLLHEVEEDIKAGRVREMP